MCFKEEIIAACSAEYKPRNELRIQGEGREGTNTGPSSSIIVKISRQINIKRELFKPLNHGVTTVSGYVVITTIASRKNCFQHDSNHGPSVPQISAG
ncbi:hypothetical protein Bpfe_013395 [Biomphalaria pfeifferi]|uniref:Uncharacterized protein n=1 Tax=Biomphalaria pfeifferi TaxID=112525 RepID=A0AAD8FA32_BIOPF|nr:hypothetical protein Bpfe_013395 [Biomphalaria pfeifferi]